MKHNLSSECVQNFSISEIEPKLQHCDELQSPQTVDRDLPAVLGVSFQRPMNEYLGEVN